MCFRIVKYSKLKLLLTVCHMKQCASSDLPARVAALEELATTDPSSWSVTCPPDTSCPICLRELRLHPGLRYECESGHTVQACASTLLPSVHTSGAVSRCRKCGAPVAASENIPGAMRVFLTGSCAYCAGSLQSDCFINPP